jgi:hypothetical protein
LPFSCGGFLNFGDGLFPQYFDPFSFGETFALPAYKSLSFLKASQIKQVSKILHVPMVLDDSSVNPVMYYIRGYKTVNKFQGFLLVPYR